MFTNTWSTPKRVAGSGLLLAGLVLACLTSPATAGPGKKTQTGEPRRVSNAQLYEGLHVLQAIKQMLERADHGTVGTGVAAIKAISVAKRQTEARLSPAKTRAQALAQRREERGKLSAQVAASSASHKASQTCSSPTPSSSWNEHESCCKGPITITAATASRPREHRRSHSAVASRFEIRETGEVRSGATGPFSRLVRACTSPLTPAVRRYYQLANY